MMAPMRAIIATTAEESRPAERNAPNGTSEINRKRTAKGGRRIREPSRRSTRRALLSDL
jgi:hypothetical protein